MFQRTIYGDANGLAGAHTLVSPTTFHNAFPKPLDPIVEDPEFAIYGDGKIFLKESYTRLSVEGLQNVNVIVYVLPKVILID